MDETANNNIMETNALPLTWRDGAIPALALVLAVTFWANFNIVTMTSGMPHLGVLVLVAVHFAAVLLTLGKRTRFAPSALVCMAAALLLAAAGAIWDASFFSLINCPVILLVAAMATFGLSGHTLCARARAIPDAVALSVLAVLSRLGRPFQTLARLGKSADRKKLGLAALSLLVALPVLAAVLWLLTSADAVFGSLFQNIRFDFPADTLWHLVRDIATALFIASALYYIREVPAPQREASAPKSRRAVLFLPLTAVLNIVYIIFCAIQIKYLFGGRLEASMAGGWAAYARSGFFQLVAVAAINMTLCLLAADKARFASTGGKLLRALLGLLLALTAMILLSAFRRMRLYIAVYGLSVLRLATLWAMAAIAFGILAAAWKLCRPDFQFFRAAGGFALALWCLLCLAGPGRIIAGYNVDHYLSGQLEEVDITYLSSLSADALPALRDLAAAGCADPSLAAAVARLETPPRDVPWTHRSLSAYLSSK